MLIMPPKEINKRYLRNNLLEYGHHYQELNAEEEINIKNTIERILSIRKLPSYMMDDSLNSFLIGAMIEKYVSQLPIGGYLNSLNYLRTRPLEPKDFQLKSWRLEDMKLPYEWIKDSKSDHTRVITGLITTIPVFDAIQIIENGRYFEIMRLYWIAHEIDCYTTYFIAMLPYHVIDTPESLLGIRIIGKELDDFQMAVAEVAYQKGSPKKIMELFGITFTQNEHDINEWLGKYEYI
jgi:hypothetical protein